MRNTLADHHRDRRAQVDDVLVCSDPDGIIISTTRTTLNDVFGRSVVDSITRALRACSLRWREIPDNSKLFSELLKTVFGPGHVIIQELILENLYRDVGLPYEYVEGYEFHDHIEMIRKTL